MSWQASEDPRCDDREASPVETLIVPRARDIGSFEVRRALPSARRQMIGPFIFFDQMGPAHFGAGNGLDVLPHPHIGLSTVTYLFQGEIVHRDSLGTRQVISPGAVNWMTAGRGIAHSERTDPAVNAAGGDIFGIQAWVALPADQEETAPSFSHHPRADLPSFGDGGTEVRLIAGDLYGERSPVATSSELFYADAAMRTGARFLVPAEHEERGIYIVEGTIEIAGDVFEAGRLLVLAPGDDVMISASEDARILLLGGEPMEGPRYVWWNFVSSSRDRIEQAKEDWRQRRFPLVPGDEEEFVPLPGS